MAKQIPLTQGKFALVDDDDYDHLMQWKWCFNNGYAMRSQYLGMDKETGKRKSRKISMHREITRAPSDLYVDHINGDGLDNRKENLRTCTQSQNMQNSSKQRNKIGNYKGVVYEKRRNTWIAYIKINGKTKYLKSHKNEKDAAITYNEAALKYFGQFARLNPIPQEGLALA